jgi:oxalate---CoA ligase
VSSRCAVETLPELIEDAARRHADTVALTAFDRAPLTYGSLVAQIVRIAGCLRSHGITRDRRLALVLPDGPDVVTAFLGASMVTAVAPLNPRYQRRELERYLQDLDAGAVILSDGIESPARAAALALGITVFDIRPDHCAGCFEVRGGEPSPGGLETRPVGEDVALIVPTSGTTSRPKIVPLTHRNLVASAAHVAAALRLHPSDRCLSVMPLFHIHGIVGAVLSSLTAGATVHCTNGFQSPLFLDWLERSEATWYTAVPTMHQAILARARDAGTCRPRSRLRFVRSSSAALPLHVADGLEGVFGVPVVDSYGMTEAAHQIASNPLPPAPRKRGSVGFPAGPDVAVLDESGHPVDIDLHGEIAIRGPSVIGGYDRNPAANRAAFTNGWFRTGDLGYFDRDGCLFIVGRLDEIINRAGEKIAPLEIDGALLEHPAVSQAVAFAVPDPQLGEEVAAAVVLHRGKQATARELRRFAAERLALFKVPKQLVVVDDIPRGATGKLQRTGLATVLGIAAASSGPAPLYRAPRTRLESELASICAEVLGLARIGIDDDFVMRGGDSLLAAQFIARVSVRLGLEVSIVDFLDPDGATIARLAAAIEEAFAS